MVRRKVYMGGWNIEQHIVGTVQSYNSYPIDRAPSLIGSEGWHILATLF